MSATRDLLERIADLGTVRRIALDMESVTTASVHACHDGVGKHATTVSVHQMTQCSCAVVMVTATMVNANVTIDSLVPIAALMHVRWDVFMELVLVMASVCVIMVFVERTARSLDVRHTAMETVCAAVRRVSALLDLLVMLVINSNVLMERHRALSMENVCKEDVSVKVHLVAMTARTRHVHIWTSVMGMVIAMRVSACATRGTVVPVVRRSYVHTIVVEMLALAPTVYAFVRRDGVESTVWKDYVQEDVAMESVSRVSVWFA